MRPVEGLGARVRLAGSKAVTAAGVSGEDSSAVAPGLEKVIS